MGRGPRRVRYVQGQGPGTEGQRDGGGIGGEKARPAGKDAVMKAACPCPSCARPRTYPGLVFCTRLGPGGHKRASHRARAASGACHGARPRDPALHPVSPAGPFSSQGRKCVPWAPATSSPSPAAPHTQCASTRPSVRDIIIAARQDVVARVRAARAGSRPPKEANRWSAVPLGFHSIGDGRLLPGVKATEMRARACRVLAIR